MTNEELAKTYSDLLILQYLQQPKAVATIKASVLPIIMDQLPLAVQDAFDIPTAEGVQLDVIGKYVGVSRNGYTLTGPITLDDADYRTLIKMVIIKNNSGSSLATIQSLLAGAFPGQITVSDNQVMGLVYTILDTLGTDDLLEILTTGGYLPAPMGVETSAVIIPAFDYPIFRFKSYAGATTEGAPFNTYAFYQLTYPWLSYQDA